MKVVLEQNVEGLGQKYDIKTVKSGYFRNFLYPRNLAVEATVEIVEKTKALREERIKKEEARKGEITKVVAGLKKEVITITGKADEKGNLFAGVTAKIISEAVNQKTKVKVPEEFIQIEKPIKKIGKYDVSIGDGQIEVEIVSEEGKDKKESKKDTKKEKEEK
ncbi:50S ribosomal protein L9 [Patescibacteria group bacterium]